MLFSCLLCLIHTCALLLQFTRARQGPSLNCVGFAPRDPDDISLSFESRFESGNLSKAVQVYVCVCVCMRMCVCEWSILSIPPLPLPLPAPPNPAPQWQVGVRAAPEARPVHWEAHSVVLLRSAQHAAWTHLPIHHRQLLQGRELVQQGDEAADVLRTTGGQGGGVEEGGQQHQVLQDQHQVGREGLESGLREGRVEGWEGLVV